MTEYLLEARNLVRSFDDGRIQALRGVDVQIRQGEFIAITGPSGSGKSTLLQLLGGLDRPNDGEVVYQGKSFSAAFDLDAYRAQDVGFVFQAFHLMPTLTALENVQIPMFESKLGVRERAEKAGALLRSMGLADRLQQFPNELSAGERQRVAIARSLANDPKILLADEPTGNLDRENSARIMALLGSIQAERNMTIIVVTHDEEVARSAQRRIHILDGRIQTCN
jgi:ABC-type lipoprotein export system ATPase subunit